MWFDEGDRVRANSAFIAEYGYGFAGLVIEIVRPAYSETVSASKVPCKRTHHVKLDDPVQGRWYLTFCPEDLERA